MVDISCRDLCEEDRKKITSLVTELTRANTNCTRIELEKSSLQEQLEELRNQHRIVVSEATELQRKYDHSLNQLKMYQEKLLALQKEQQEERKLDLKEEAKIDKLEEEINRLNELVTHQENSFMQLVQNNTMAMHSPVRVSQVLLLNVLTKLF